VIETNQSAAVALPNPGLSNLASVQVLAELRQDEAKNRKSFTAFVNETCEVLEKDRQEVWREIESGIELTAYFIAGNQDLVRGHRTGKWRIVRRMETTADPVRALPKLGFYVTNLISKNVNGRADCDVVPGDDREESKGAARKNQILLDWLETQVYRERFCQQEILAGISSGLKARYYRWSDDGDYGYAERPVYQDVPVNAPGGWYCPTCEAGGEKPAQEAAETSNHEAAELPATEQAEDQIQAAAPMGAPMGGQMGAMLCPECGGATIETPGMSTTVTQQVGTKKVKRGMVRCDSVFLSQLRFNLSVPLEQSHWLRYEQNLPKDQIRAALPGINLDKAFEDSSNQTAEMAERLATSTPFWVGQGGRTGKQNASLVTWWLDPCTYSHLTFAEPLQTLSGQTFPAGTKYIDAFPTGMCLVTVKGIKYPLAVFNEHHKDHWVSAPYHIKLLSGLGQGIGEALEAQRQWNLVMGMTFQQIRTAATPGTVYDKDVISPDDAQLLNVPGMNIPAQTGNLPDGKTLRDALYTQTGQALPSHVPWYVGQVDYLMQSGTQSVDFSGALPGVDNKTFGGAQLGAQLAQSLHDPILALQADMDERGALLMLKLWRENAIDACWVPKIGERDNYEGEWLSALEIGGEIQVKARAGSWRARSDFDKRESFERALNATAAFGGVAMVPPKVLRQIGELYNVDFAGDTISGQARLCRIRLNQIRENLPTFEQSLQVAQQLTPGAPDTLAMLGAGLIAQIVPPIDPEEPGHLESIDYLREWFIDDEGIEASPLFRQAVKLLIQAHLQAYALEQGATAEAQAVSAPAQIADAQQLQQQEQAAQQKEIPRSASQKKLDSARKNSGQRQAASSQPAQPARVAA